MSPSILLAPRPSRSRFAFPDAFGLLAFADGFGVAGREAYLGELTFTSGFCSSCLIE